VAAFKTFEADLVGHNGLIDAPSTAAGVARGLAAG
jgi:hypothetical protein